MKLEEAIAKAKILNDSLKELTDEYEGQGSFIAAGMAVSFKLVLDTILTALRPVSRELVEKVFPGCALCNWGGLDFVGVDGDGIYLSKPAENEKFRFCPVCGKPLTDEAVEMVMERLNKLEETKK